MSHFTTPTKTPQRPGQRPTIPNVQPGTHTFVPPWWEQREVLNQPSPRYNPNDPFMPQVIPTQQQTALDRYKHLISTNPAYARFMELLERLRNKQQNTDKTKLGSKIREYLENLGDIYST